MTKDQESAASGSKNDASDPFFIHHSDHPGMVLVSKILNGNNYATWCRSMRISLSAKNKLGFVNGTIKAPSEKTNPETFEVWQRCNDMVLSWLLNSIEPDIAESVLYSSTAQEIWEDLKERFSQLNAPRIFEIQRTIASLSQEQMSVAVYYTKIKSLWDELSSYSDVPACSCGAMKKHVEQEERNSLMQFLMGLNESYSAIRGQILLMQPLPKVRKAYSLITQEEKQRDLGSSQAITEPAAMAVRNNHRSNSSGRKPLHCSHCDQDHHTVDKCYKLHGYPPGHRLHKSGKGKGKGSSSSANNVASNGPSLQEVHTAMPSLSEDQYLPLPAPDPLVIQSSLPPTAPPSPAPLVPPTRQSERHKVPNVRLQDYVCSHVTLPNDAQSESSSSHRTSEREVITIPYNTGIVDAQNGPPKIESNLVMRCVVSLQHGGWLGPSVRGEPAEDKVGEVIVKFQTPM
ncbi:hypothetical protein L3X38_022419 [Prunus dulcis]|uniref:Retrotransposon Copia-like N-terminal domain-containing protein n=1 Tax=Prunus dulcis TaxID=3755 RepID=A0AAD4Z4A4_PRUDU|nr:hypothetical protein L3X38_022419 [Prunus dulcis]